MGCVSRQPIIKGILAKGGVLGVLLLAILLSAMLQLAILQLTSGAQADQTARRLLVLGDSLSAGYGLPAEHAFPAQLERALKARGYNIRVINTRHFRGYQQGRSSASALGARVQAPLRDCRTGRQRRPARLDPRQTRLPGRYYYRPEGKRHQGVARRYAGAPNLGPEYGKTFNGAFRDLAAKHSIGFMPFFLKDVAMQAHLNQRDGIHPTRAGVAIIVRNIMPFVVKLLGPARLDCLHIQRHGLAVDAPAALLRKIRKHRHPIDPPESGL